MRKGNFEIFLFSLFNVNFSFQSLKCCQVKVGGDRPNRSIFAILKIGIRYLAQICSRVKEKKIFFFFRNDPFRHSYGGHLGFLA